MERAKKLISGLKSFNRWKKGSHLTQFEGGSVENFVESIILAIYEDAKSFKMGSQQHPDFIIVPKSVEDSINKFNKEVTKKNKITLDVLTKWEESKYNKQIIRMVRVETKTGKSEGYILNDTFPEPSPELDEIYVLFSIKEEKVIITTSATMSKECLVEPPIILRVNTSKKTVRNFGKKLKDIWEGTGITTAARPTYRMNKSYAHKEATPLKIASIFYKGGFKKNNHKTNQNPIKKIT